MGIVCLRQGGWDGFALLWCRRVCSHVGAVRHGVRTRYRRQKCFWSLTQKEKALKCKNNAAHVSYV